jgi:hypothetical protein
MDINILKSQERELFLFPLSDTDIIERVGVEQHKNLSIIYACLSAYEPKFISYSNTGKERVAKTLLSDITKIAKVERWNQYSSSIIGQSLFKKTLIEKVNKTGVLSEPNKTIFTAIPIRDIIDVIIGIDTDITLSIREYILYLIRIVDNNVSKKLKEITPIIIPEQISKMSDIIHNIIQNYTMDTYSYVYNKFETDNTDYQPNMMTTDKKRIGWLSECLNRDLFIIDSHTFIPLHTGITNKRKALVLLNHNNTHYEYIVKIVDDESISEFYSTDPLIKRMAIFTYQPSIVCEIYPHLVYLLPKQFQSVTKKYATKCSPNRKSPLNNRLFR